MTLSGSGLIEAVVLLVAVLVAAALVSGRVGGGKALLWAGAGLVSVGKLVSVALVALTGFGAGGGFRGQRFPGGMTSPGAFPTMGGGRGNGTFPQGSYTSGSIGVGTTLAGWLETAFTIAGVVLLMIAIVQAARAAKPIPTAPAATPPAAPQPPAATPASAPEPAAPEPPAGETSPQA